MPAAAVDLVVDSGLDVWFTRDDGRTFFSFEKEPLPADFFCSGSAPFTGTIRFKGAPIATHPEGALGGADTILLRLDDAVFDEEGVAVTRLQMQALHFKGMELLENECGKFRAEVVLAGEQPITEMRIFREKTLALRDGSQVASGHFAAEVAVNAKLVLTPVGHKGEVLEVPRKITFPPRPTFLWSSKPRVVTPRYQGFVVVDTNADGTPDTFMPGTSRNFSAGTVRPAKTQSTVGQAAPQLELLTERQISCGQNCHCDQSCSSHCLSQCGVSGLYQEECLAIE
jgi:hypothetical protein